MAENIRKKRTVREAYREYALTLLNQVDALQDKSELKLLQYQLSEKQKRIDRLDEEILDLAFDEDDGDCGKEVSDAESTKYKFKQKVQRALVQIDNVLLDLAKEERPEKIGSQESLSLTATLPRSKVRARLPKLDLKKFRGKPYDWQKFWDAFRSPIDENEQLVEVDKFSYLNSLEYRLCLTAGVIDHLSPPMLLLRQVLFLQARN